MSENVVRKSRKLRELSTLEGMRKKSIPYDLYSRNFNQLSSEYCELVEAIQEEYEDFETAHDDTRAARASMNFASRARDAYFCIQDLKQAFKELVRSVELEKVSAPIIVPTVKLELPPTVPTTPTREENKPDHTEESQQS